MSNPEIQSLLSAHEYKRGPKPFKTTYTAVRVQPSELEVMRQFAQQHGCDLAVLMRAGAMFLINQATLDTNSSEVS